MIRDLSQNDKIQYSKMFIDIPHINFLLYWFLSPEGMFEDIDFYMVEPFEFTLKAKLSGIICGLLILPFMFLTFILIFFIASVCRDYGNKNLILQSIGRGIIFLFFLFPFALVKFPFSLYSYFAFKKRALFNLLEVDSDYDTSSK